MIQTASCDSDIGECTYFYSATQKTRFNKAESLNKILDPVCDFFKCSNARLSTAALWYLRAMTSDRNMDKILESAITLEVLLGDQEMSDKIGLTRLMANRCAYALGKDLKDRENLMKKFIRFYGLRSQIVHAGRMSHDEADVELVQWGIELAGRLLVHEQKLEGCA